MNKLKIFFSQSLMISTGTLFVFAIMEMIGYFVNGCVSFEYPWYHSVSIILNGILTTVPTYIIFRMSEVKSKILSFWCIVAHFIIVGAITLTMGYFFGWYGTWKGFAIVLAGYIFVYIFVWGATLWMTKVDEKKINMAIDKIRDEE